MSYKISVIGMGYVGCGNGLLLSKNHNVSIMDIDQKKVNDFNNKKLPISDPFAQNYLENESLNIEATSDLLASIQGARFILLCLPTNFDENTEQYDTNVLEEVIGTIVNTNKEAVVVIKSTVNIGYTESLQQNFNTKKIIFSPEFLREGHALEDNFNPSRIIIGGLDDDAKSFGEVLSRSINSDNTPLLFMSTTAAESVKLFSNTYLAMRVAFFNELDGFCLKNSINTGHVIEGVSHDNRIGSFYNNPSFGFGGYCLPKDSKQLLSRFGNIPHDLMQAIQDSNAHRADFLVSEIMLLSPKTIGVYKLAMKEGLDNSRGSSIFHIIKKLIIKKIKILVYDSSLITLDLDNILLVDSFDNFTESSDLILTNRLDDQIRPFASKIFTRDIFSSDE